MSEPLPDIHAYADSVAAMALALAAHDEGAFRTALSAFDAVRDGEVLTGVRKVTVELQSALQRFEIDSRLIGLAQNQVPDARRRLEHVLRLTNDAAHRTMDLVDQCGPLTEQIEQGAATLAAAATAATATATATAAATADGIAATAGAPERFRAHIGAALAGIRSRLVDVRLAQSYQDLTGQIVRSVMALVDELQRALSELAAIVDGKEAVLRRGETMSRGRGPVVPGIEQGEVVSGQQDVDALLSDLGM
jgi:chemotaxis protein CheZ